jgi:hypothetical protein
VAFAGCGGSPHHVVRVNGSIGSVHVDRSDRAAVIAFAGKPDATAAGRAPGYFPYRALGYDCARKRMDNGVYLAPHAAICRTAFFFDRRTGKLETFYTSSSEYSEGHGVRIGMKQAEAEGLLHRRLVFGCTAALHFESPTGSLSIEFTGGTEDGTSIKGAHVDAFVVHGHHRDAGIFDCL